MWLLPVMAAVSCGEPPLPETYGVYARSDDQLVQLDKGQVHRLSSDASFVVFDRSIAGGTLGLSGVPLDQVFFVRQAAFVRYSVERLGDSGGDDVVELTISRSGEWLDLPNRLELAFAPVKGETEMLEVSPVELIDDGLYGFVVGRDFYRFTVGITADEIGDSPAASCRDLHLRSRRPASNFSWADWRRTSQGASRTENGNWIEEAEHKECAVLDEEAARWRHSVLEAIEAGDLLRAVQPVKMLRQYSEEESQPLLVELLGAARLVARREFANDEWERAAELATLVTNFVKDDEMFEIAVKARQEAAADADEKRKSLEEEARARLVSSRTGTAVLGEFTVISGVKSSQRGIDLGDDHIVRVTDVGIKGLAHLPGWITSTNNLEDEYWFCLVSDSPVTTFTTNNGEPAARVEFRNFWTWAAVFHSADERDKFVRVLNGAKDAWYRKYGDLVIDGECPKAVPVNVSASKT